MKPEFQIISNFIEKNKRVLDVGCGDGILMEFLKKNKELQKKYNKEGAFPTLLALDANGKVKNRISAYSMLRDPSGYFSFLDKARAIR